MLLEAGSFQTAPIGNRAAPVHAANGDRKQNFSQIGHARVGHGLRLDIGAGQRVGDALHAIGDARRVAEHLPEDDPAIRECLVCSMTPGSTRALPMYVEPPSVRSAPTTAATSSTLSTPFCSVSATAPSPTMRSRTGSAPALPYALTAKIATSTAGTLAASSSARTGTTKSPRGLLTLSPCARIAARCAPRATNVTSWPACASLAP